MSLELLFELFEFGGVERQNILRSRLGDAAYTSLVGDGVLVKGRDMRFLACPHCAELHEVLEDATLNGSLWVYDCPDVGRAPAPGFDPTSLSVNGARFAAQIFKAVTGASEVAARDRSPGMVWEAWLENEALPRPLFLARQLGELTALLGLQRILKGVSNVNRCRILVAEPHVQISDVLQPASVLDLTRLMRLSDAGRLTCVGAEPPLADAATKKPGRRDLCARALEIHRDRVDAGLALASNTAEAHVLRRMNREEGVPEKDLPSHKALMNRLSTERARRVQS